LGTYDAVGELALLDGVSLDFGSGVDLAGKFNLFDALGSNAYDGLFFSASAVNAPYATAANGGSFMSLTSRQPTICICRSAPASLGAGMVRTGQVRPPRSARLGARSCLTIRAAPTRFCRVSWNSRVGRHRPSTRRRRASGTVSRNFQSGRADGGYVGVRSAARVELARLDDDGIVLPKRSPSSI